MIYGYMVVCLFNQFAWNGNLSNGNLSDAKRPGMINSADQKSCRVVGCIKGQGWQ